MQWEECVSPVDPYAGMIRIRWYGSSLRPLTLDVFATRRGHPVDKCAHPASEEWAYQPLAEGN